MPEMIPVDFDGAAPALVAEAQIEENMAAAGYKPPASYATFARENGGKRYSGPNRFVRNLDSGEPIGLSTVYHYDPRVPLYSVQDIREQVAGLLPEGLFPIISTEFGGEVCLDYRGGDDQPSVVLYDYEAQEGREIGRLAPNFPAFLEAIGPRPAD
ncbi:MAG: SMI1/KNR4 family protein [Erythrobacter sp.]|jgi:hypothetical protein|nr:SMI1/KNR4 family protein [Erythrobacter sp.]